MRQRRNQTAAENFNFHMLVTIGLKTLLLYVLTLTFQFNLLLSAEIQKEEQTNKQQLIV